MSTEPRTMHYTDIATPKNEGIRYMLTVGRRQPMHQAHLSNLREIMDHGYTPIIVIGSTNTAETPNGYADPLFEPLANPLTAEQQREQIHQALAGKVEGKDYHLVEFPDFGDNDKWNHALAQMLKGQIKIDGKYPDLSRSTAFHFVGKPEDKKPRKLRASDGSQEEVLAYFWEQTLADLGLPVLESSPRFDTKGLNATQLRGFNLDTMDADQSSMFAAPSYITQLAHQARDANPSKAALAHLPVSMLDLSLERLAREKHISTEAILATIPADTDVTLDSIRNAARTLNGSMQKMGTVRLKIASASCNQTVYDFATNIPNIMAAIDKAVEDGADILALEELGLTGYAADDYHQWNKDNAQIWKHIEFIAHYAQSKNPNLVISLGTPWHYADKEASASDPLYNLNQRPYNTQMTITGGKVVAIAVKSMLADGPAEYEPRQFNAWPAQKGTIQLTLPDGSTVPFGKPVVSLEHQEQTEDVQNEKTTRITLVHEICAEGWPGVHDDLTVDAREQEQARHIVSLAKTHDVSVVLNPSASKPQPSLNKERIRAEGLCTSGSKYAGVFVYTNYLGSGSGTYAAEGSQIFAQDGKVIHHGQRYSTADMSYSSTVVDVPVAERGEPDTRVEHTFTAHDYAKVGQEAAFENVAPEHLALEEYARSISLWLRDYMRKQPFCQGYVISLSGGKDSAYGAVAITMMVDLEVKEHGVEGFFKRFPTLKYKDAVLETLRGEGEEAAIAAIKKNLITCVYMPTDISSDRTQNAARFLIEGGALPDGRTVKGIGGTFYVAPIQRVMDEQIIAYSGLDIDAVAKQYTSQILGDNPAYAALSTEETIDLASAKIVRTIKQYVDGDLKELPEYIAKHCAKPIPTWANPADDGTLQNIQARVRLPTPWTVANKEGKIALVTSNESEAVLGYTTAGGDMHMGGANPIGGVPKDEIIPSLAYFEKHGLQGLSPLESLYFVNKEKPSAELRKESEDTKPQTDEDDLGFSYRQSKIMEKQIIEERNMPQRVFESLRQNPEFPDDAAQLRDILLKFTKRWEAAQFKRIMGTLAPYVGTNVDPHQSVRTTVLGDHFKTDMAQLTLSVMAGQLGSTKRGDGAQYFEQAFGISLEDAQYRASISAPMRHYLLSHDIAELLEPTARSAVKQVMDEGEMAKAHHAFMHAHHDRSSHRARAGESRNTGGWTQSA